MPFSKLPAASNLNFPKAARGPMPTTVPLSVKIQSAAAREHEHETLASAGGATMHTIKAVAQAIMSCAGVPFMCFLHND